MHATDGRALLYIELEPAALPKSPPFGGAGSEPLSAGASWLSPESAATLVRPDEERSVAFLQILPIAAIANNLSKEPAFH